LISLINSIGQHRNYKDSFVTTKYEDVWLMIHLLIYQQSCVIKDGGTQPNVCTISLVNFILKNNNCLCLFMGSFIRSVLAKTNFLDTPSPLPMSYIVHLQDNAPLPFSPCPKRPERQSRVKTSETQNILTDGP